MRSRRLTVGPKDNGLQMSLKDFDLAEAQEGYTYNHKRMSQQ